MNIKEALYKQCESFIDNRLKTVEATIKDIQTSLTTETKSTAGDKHETGRAMLQLEREKAGNQLSEIQKTKEILSKIDVKKTATIVSLGSVIYTSGIHYFIAISAGEITIDSITFYAISANTPIAKLLLGKTVGDTLNFRNVEFTIEKLV
ncbi:3-oxoacyl-ACP synthase [Seonamhaeicola algicola]|uniref:3-oxoacyl-ACP synthase n=1 Tax=Seonamhaeicola algicola TaxID=1719036 RepID=A0A5C7B4T6_9FLAO|nr:3-oxoacyl-ACP synthase [Seonamhaeicola algicola]TXE12912.1 3-oxoacyl-ACP synthase [Seonamhaeicola algicola]